LIDRSFITTNKEGAIPASKPHTQARTHAPNNQPNQMERVSNEQWTRVSV